MVDQFYPEIDFSLPSPPAHFFHFRENRSNFSMEMVFNVVLKVPYKYVTVNTELDFCTGLLFRKCLQVMIAEVWSVGAL